MGLQKVVGSVGSIECNVRTTAGEFQFTHMGATFVPVSGKTATFLQQDIHTWYSRHLIAVADVEETTPQQHEPTTAHAIVWQNQRRIAVFGLGGEWSGESLGVIPGDPPPFSDPNGQVRYSGTTDHRLLPRGCAWAAGSEWYVLPNDGSLFYTHPFMLIFYVAIGIIRVPGRWEHSIGFQEVLGGWSEAEGITDSVRRRCWTRLYALSAVDEPRAAEVPEECSNADSNEKAQGAPRRTPSPKQGTLLSLSDHLSLCLFASLPLNLSHFSLCFTQWPH